MGASMGPRDGRDLKRAGELSYPLTGAWLESVTATLHNEQSMLSSVPVLAVPAMQLPTLPAMPSLTAAPGQTIRAGIDLVRISDIASSLATFGDAFAQRLFTDAERDYANSASDAALMAARYAARFAAREAAIKAFNLAEVGVNWRELEVVRLPDGSCTIVPSGRALAAIGPLSQCVLSMSHEGDYAVAMVLAVLATNEDRGQL